MKNSRMFHLVHRTWNPITGCRFLCKYCWARRLVETKLKNTEKYKEGFKPKLHPGELKRKFKHGELVFVSDMGDMWGPWVPDNWIMKVLDVVRKYPRTTFLFLTKYPRRYVELRDELKELSNIILGCTIETDDTLKYLQWKLQDGWEAPAPDARFRDMLYLRYVGFRTMVSVEPILDFTPFFPGRIAELEPEFVYVGYDNYNNRLPEPPLKKTYMLIKTLREHGIVVYEKTIRKAWWEEGGRG